MIQIQEEKDLLEGLLKQQRKGYPVVKVDKNIHPASLPQDFRPARALWKVPEILKD
jgi:hypothetical protein